MAEKRGFRAPTTPDWIDGYDLPPQEPTGLSGDELAERYAYSQAMLACAYRLLGEKKAELVILKAKVAHIRKKEMFLMGGSDKKKWQAEGQIENDPEYMALAFELTHIDAFCQLQENIVNQWLEVSRELSREQSRRSDEIRGGVS